MEAASGSPPGMQDRGGRPAGRTLIALDFSSDLAEVGPAIEALCTRLRADRGPGLPLDCLDRVAIAVTEAVNNVIEHAYAGRRGRPVRIGATIRGASLVVAVLDQGVAPPASLVLRGTHGPVGDDDRPRALSSLSEGGYGWSLIRQTADAVSIARIEGWTVLTLEFDLDG